MPKKIFAVTNVKTGSGDGQFITAGNEVKQAELGISKAQLLELHEAGAIEVRTVDDEPAQTPDESGSATETPEGGSETEE